MRKLVCIILTLVFVLACAACVYADQSEGSAEVIKLEKAEGTVSVTNASGKKVTVRNDLRLYNGYTVKTSSDSSAYISLDNSTAVLLESSSKLTLKKAGTKIDLMLESGTVVTDVSRKLNSNQTVNIHTTNMVTGIRGTGLEVTYNPRIVTTWINMMHGRSTNVYKLLSNLFNSMKRPVTIIGAGQGLESGSGTGVQPKTGNIVMGNFKSQTLSFVVVQQGASARVTDGFNETFGVNAMTDEEKNELTVNIAAGVEEQNKQDVELDTAAQLYAEEAVSPSAITTDGAIVASGGAIVTTEGAIVDPVFEQQVEADTVDAVVVDIPEETTSVTVDEDDGEMTVQEPNPETSNTFTVTWMNYDGSILERDENVTYGSDPSYDGPEPEKAADAEYRYSFRGWDPEITSVTANTEYTADYDSSARSYGSPVWTWAWSVEGGYSDAVAAFTTNDDATEHTERIDASVATGGSEASCTAGGTTVYTATAIFLGEEYQDVKTVTEESLGHDLVHHEAQAATCGGIGWDAYETCSRCDYTTYKEIAALGHSYGEPEWSWTGYTTASAIFTCSHDTSHVETVNAEISRSDAADKYTYTATVSFNGQTYTDSKTETRTYTVTWKDYDGTVLASDSAAEYGSNPSYQGTSTPTREATAEYTYTFAGWDPAITEVTGDATYTATFSAVKNKYAISFVNGNETLQSTEVEYGATPGYNGETPTKDATNEFTYTFVGWEPEVTSVTGETTYTATFSAVKNQYTIAFVNDDGNSLQSGKLDYGATPSYTGATPEKAATAEYTYTFNGWDPAIETVTGDATYTATFSAVKNKYAISFVNGNETLQSGEVEYGATPSYSGETPTKAATDEFTYSFAGWNPAITSVNGAATYTATFSAVKNKYAISFVNGNETLQSTEVEYGATPSYSGETPTKAATDEFTYTFAGWDPAITAVNGATTYTATFSALKNKYAISFVNGNETLQSGEVEYGAIPSYSGETPTKAATDEFTYTFSGWDPAIKAVEGAATYTATFSAVKNKYAISFVNGNETLQSTEVEYGATPSYSGETPTKAATDEFTYTFAGWEPEIASVTGEATYTATFSAVVNTYTVTWKNEDGTILETDENVPYDTTPEYNGEVPAKEDDEQYTYAFLAWDKELTVVTGDVTYTATFESITRTYGVYWNNWDGSTLWISTGVPYGTVPEYPEGEVDGVPVPVPSRDADAQYTYTFNGWDPEPVAVTGAATYTATYSAVVNKYSVAFVDEDGSTVLKAAAQYDYGTAAADIVKPADPTKESTVDKVYTFIGWTPELADVTANATYAAVYSEAARTYTVTWKDHDGTVLASDSAVEYGSTPAYPGDAAPAREATAEYTFTFEGWDPEVTAVNGDAVYTASYSALKNRYTITWKNDAGSTIGTDTLEYGSTPTHAAITKDATPEYTYTFSGWTPSITTVTTDAAYTATFSAVKNKYAISFVNGNETLQSTEVEYGATPSYSGETPTKAATDEFTYTFAGWEPEVISVTGEATYTATFSAVKNKYAISFVNGNETLQSTEVEYGETPRYSGSTPTKASDAAFTYTFADWEPEIASVTGAATYTASFSAVKNRYTVTFDSDGGTEIESQTVEYEGTAAEPASEPVREGYSFDGWYAPDAEEAYIFETPITGDITLTAHWTPDTVTFTAPYMTFYRAEYSFLGITLSDGVSEKNSHNANEPDMTFDTTVGSDVTLSILNDNPDIIVGVTPAAVSGVTIAPVSGSDSEYTISGFTTDVALKFDVTVKMPATDYGTDVNAFATDYNGDGLNSFTCQYPENLTPSGTSSNVVFEPYAVYYTVTFEDEEGNGTNNEGQQVRYNGKVTAPSIPTSTNVAMEFVGWCIDDDREELYDFDTPVESNFTLYAKWIIKTVTFTAPYMTPERSSKGDFQFTIYTENGDQHQVIGEQEISLEVVVGDTVTIQAYSYDECVSGLVPVSSAAFTMNEYEDSDHFTYYEITGYTTDVALQFDMEITMPTDSDKSVEEFVEYYYGPNDSGIRNLVCRYPENLTSPGNTAVVHYEPYAVYYTVRFVDEEGNGTDQTGQQVRYNETVEKPADPTYTGAGTTARNFFGWCSDSDRMMLYNFNSPVTGDLTLYAKWSNAIVTFVTGEGATQIEPVAASGWDLASPVPEPKKDGLSFYGWYENANYEGEPFILGYTSAINSDLTLYARFEPCMDIPYMSVNYDTFGITGTQVKDFYDGVEDKTYHRALISNGSISFSIIANGFEFTPDVENVTLTETQTSDGTVYSASGLTESFTLTGDAKIKILEHSAQSVIERLGEIDPDDYNETTIERYPQSGGIKTLTVQYPSFISVGELNSLNRYPDFVSFEAYDTYVITLNTMGGDPLDPVIADPADAPVTVWITEPEFEGHTFAGWFQDEDYRTPFIPYGGTTEATVITGDITLYAKWD